MNIGRSKLFCAFGCGQFFKELYIIFASKDFIKYFLVGSVPDAKAFALALFDYVSELKLFSPQLPRYLKFCFQFPIFGGQHLFSCVEKVLLGTD